jgi:hypothetical protein
MLPSCDPDGPLKGLLAKFQRPAVDEGAQPGLPAAVTPSIARL